MGELNLRKVGLIGGMSWVSTRSYYEQINHIIQQRTDRSRSAPLLIESLDFGQIYALQDDEESWDRAAIILGESARRLEDAGATALIIGANSMHRVYDRVKEQVQTPIFHIAECIGEKMAEDGVKVAALLGTRNVMTESFYRRRLVAHGVDLLPPNMGYVEELDRIIYEELMIGRATRDSERALKSMITLLEKEGAGAIVLACTELEQVVDIDANVLPIYDSVRIHAKRAADWILGSN